MHFGEALARKSRRGHGVFLDFSLLLSLHQGKERRSNIGTKLKVVGHYEEHNAAIRRGASQSKQSNI